MHLNGNQPVQLEVAQATTDPEVTPRKPKRRKFTARCKLRILEETDRLASGELGAYLRKNGIYSSYLSAWRRQRDAGAIAELGKPAGRAKAPLEPTDRQVALLTKELDNVKEQLRQANLILEVQKKVLSLCGDTGQGKQRAQ